MTPKHCILVVDDEPDICDSVHALLHREFRVLSASSALEGMRVMQENDVHVVMTDQRMPRTTGVELLASVRQQHPQAVRILFTGYADVDAIVEAINTSQIFRFVKKPWNPVELEQIVRDAAAEHDRIHTSLEQSERLNAEIRGLRERVDQLEGEVRALRDRYASAPARSDQNP